MPALDELWDMLIQRCPNLEHLSLDGHWYHPTAFPRVCEGRWPKLRSLTIGEVVVNWEEATHTEALDVEPKQRPFIQFLECHTAIKRLNLTGMIQSTVSFEPLSETALPALESFSGNILHITKLPARAKASIHTLRVPTATFGAHIVTELKLFPTLRSMTKLMSLELHVVLHPELACDLPFIQEFVQSCPFVESLEFSCVRGPGITFVSASPKFPIMCTQRLTEHYRGYLCPADEIKTPDLPDSPKQAGNIERLRRNSPH
jgi:hypothetical protein